MRTDPTIVCRVTNDLMDDDQDNLEQEHSVYSEIEEVVEPNKQESQEANRPDPENTEMYESGQHGQPYTGARNSFFFRHSSRSPGQPPHSGHHQLHFHVEPQAGRNALYAPARHRGAGAQRGARGARGGRVAAAAGARGG